jgi:hypothetical protein
MADITLNFVNASNDANNSQVVIFQKNAADIEFVTAWRLYPVEAGIIVTVPLDDENGAFYVAVTDPTAENDGMIDPTTFTSEPVPIGAGQTANVSGDPVAGYVIDVEG